MLGSVFIVRVRLKSTGLEIEEPGFGLGIRKRERFSVFSLRASLNGVFWKSAAQ